MTDIQKAIKLLQGESMTEFAYALPTSQALDLMQELNSRFPQYEVSKDDAVEPQRDSLHPDGL